MSDDKSNELALAIYQMQDPSPSPAMVKLHTAAIIAAGGFYPAEPTDPAILQAAIQKLQNAEPLLNLQFRYAWAYLIDHPALRDLDGPNRRKLEDLLCRLRLSRGIGHTSQLARTVMHRYPLMTVNALWNTAPEGARRTRRISEGELIVQANEQARGMAQAKQRQLDEEAARIAGYDAKRLHAIAKGQAVKGGPNADRWALLADQAAQAEGLGSRHNLDNTRLAAEARAATQAQARSLLRQQGGAIARFRSDALKAAKHGDAARAQYLRQQAADLRRMTIDPETGDTTVTHQPPARPGRGGPRANAGGARPGTGGARPGAGRKPLFTPAPPEPDADSTAHVDPTVSAARRWSAYAPYLAKHFTYVAATGELIGPSGRALDLRHPVSTPVGALRPGLLIAALLHGTVTRRYALPRGSEAASRWPLHTLSVSVVDRERDAGPAQPGTPAHLLVPPAPRLRGLALELRP